MLQKLNTQLEGIMPIITPTSVIIGVLLSGYFKDFAFLVPWFFAFMTFSGSLSSNYKSFKQVLLHPFVIFLTLAILHIIMPLWAWCVGHFVFHDDMLTTTGLILAMLIPTGITSFIWVSIYRGNTALTLAVILIDTFLSPFIVPYVLSLMIGEKVELDIIGMMKGLLGMVVIPSIVGMIFNQYSNGKAKTVLGPKLAPFSKIVLAVIVIINSAVIAPYLRHIDGKLVLIAMVVFFLAFLGYLTSFLLARLFKMNRQDVVAVTFLGGMRNISVGAVLAVSYFPAPVAVPVVIGMLFQQVLASIYGYMVNRFYQKRIDLESMSS